MGRVELIRGDITHQALDAIVNAANATLLGGGGVDGAIHRAAGPALREECRAVGGCAVGGAVITGAGRLAARHVIHTVGPVWRGGDAGEAGLLARCHLRVIALAADHGCAGVALPAISTGAYGFPVRLAAPIALGAVRSALRERPSVELVRFVLFSADDLAAYRAADPGV